MISACALGIILQLAYGRGYFHNVSSNSFKAWHEDYNIEVHGMKSQNDGLKLTIK